MNGRANQSVSLVDEWAEVLSVLAPDVAAAVSPWAKIFASVMGPLRTQTVEGTGDPDGYNGVTRRGPYDRLLLSEWLLADEVPEEFVRRAAMREHTFHQLVRREQAMSKTSVVLFDSGPYQLGSPRLAHLALLFTLVKRAQKANARFAWGVLQQPPHGDISNLRLGVTEKNINQLMEARQPLPPSDSDIRSWHDFEARNQEWNDVWIIGSYETVMRWTTARGFRSRATGGTVAVREDIDPSAASLTATVRQRTHSRDVTLALPNQQVRTRLLRASIQRVNANAQNLTTPGDMKPRSEPVISGCGGRVAVRIDGNDVMLVGVPNSVRAGSPRPRRFSPQRSEKILAVSWYRKTLVVLSVRGKYLVRYQLGGKDFPNSRTDIPTSPDALAAAMSWSQGDQLRSFLTYKKNGVARSAFVDSDSVFWEIRSDGVFEIGRYVETTSVLREELKVMVRDLSDPSNLASLSHHGTVHSYRTVDEDSTLRGCYFSPSGGAPLFVFEHGLCVQIQNNQLVPDTVFTISQSLQPIGVIHATSHMPLRLVALSADRKSIVLCYSKEQHTVYTHTHEILHAAQSASGTRVACVTSEPGMFVFNLDASELALIHPSRGTG
jgi:hypothetical protein